jgi:hypothetical protein
MIGLGKTAEDVLRRTLAEIALDCIMIPAGLRALPEHTALFEKVINMIHMQAPSTKFASTPIQATRPTRCSV